MFLKKNIGKIHRFPRIRKEKKLIKIIKCYQKKKEDIFNVISELKHFYIKSHNINC